MSIGDPEYLNIKKRWSAERRQIKPRAISVSQDGLVESSLLSSDQRLPLVVEPKFKDVDLIGWTSKNGEHLETRLLEHGGILFRGFGLRTQADFEGFLRALSISLMTYMEGATPRTELGDRIYTSTEFPPDRTISIHNELCYVTTWPMKIFFFCIKPAEQGGETPIGDVRKVFKRIAPEIRHEFEKRGWMLLRNFGAGFGLPWQTSYHLSDKSELEEYFRRSKISYEWKEEHLLRTRQVRPATTVHPKTGEPVWFNHIGFWHVSSLEGEVRRHLLEEFGEAGLPFNTYYGDGSRIEDSVIDEIRCAYEAETITFRWREGDLLMLDNMLVAHGRKPFSGARKVLTAMGEPFTRDVDPDSH